MVNCDECGVSFSSISALNAHRRDRVDHAAQQNTLQQAIISVQQAQIQQLVAQWTALQQFQAERFIARYNALRDEVEGLVVQWEASQKHLRDVEPYCTRCKRWFGSAKALYQHLARPPHNWCFTCSRDFASETALTQHHASPVVHRARDIICPLCSAGFKASSSITMHIESGACHNFSRHQVTAAVHAMSITPSISNPNRIQAGSSTTRQSTTNYSATDFAFNGTAYECYLCHRTFKKLLSLHSHLSSPAHDDNEFKCPKCRVEFKLVSGLIQHIESEVCGLAKFEQVQDQVGALTDQFTRQLRFR